MTREEYLAFERASSERHEFHDGEVFPVRLAEIYDKVFGSEEPPLP